MSVYKSCGRIRRGVSRVDMLVTQKANNTNNTLEKAKHVKKNHRFNTVKKRTTPEHVENIIHEKHKKILKMKKK